jgi:acetyl-CoA synthetase (ADP-forming)
MMRGIKAYRILEEIRGLPAADLDQLSEILIRVGEIGLEYEAVKEIDINPLILSGSKPVAVDALVVLNPVNA